MTLQTGVPEDPGEATREVLPKWCRLRDVEKTWVSYYPFLLSRGYRLRPRYDPDWIPSWTLPGKKLHPSRCEDSLYIWLKDNILDAVRMTDNAKVVVKLVPTDSAELHIVNFLSDENKRSDPRNRTIPILDIFLYTDSPEYTFMVMPYMRRFNYPPFHCRGEFVDAMRQFLEGLQFMHENNIAHCDIAPKNMMMEESRVVPKGSHFTDDKTHVGMYESFWWKERCSVGPVPYYYIDFGLSHHYPDGNAGALTIGRRRGFDEIPELSDTKPYNPFKVDIYQLGMTVLDLVKTYPALDMFQPLGEKMCSKRPDDRPTPDEALQLFDGIVHGLSKSKLSARMWQRGDMLIHRITRTFCGCYIAEPHEEIEY
ncbi:kinase-like domain-containing protein [Mycena belliarum]|uniref:Kinase-like domain-containing protein n=1 Tax=Mycena belliarum TaxID=1033014 RepID=A0AAD6XRP6_9AGAR|nr:kinase-like domain-containing protein [Mycena belliae]